MFENIPLHPAIVHLPIGLVLILPIVTLILMTFFFRGSISKQILLVIVALHGVLVGSTYIALETGENEEHVVEKVISESLIEGHEERAESFMAGTVVVFLMSLALIGHSLGLPPKPVLSVVLLGQFALVLLGYKVGHSGGELVYIHGASQVYTSASGTASANQPIQELFSEKEDHHDDD
ncbi:MAG: hypothetical protein CL677_06570 [Bdellovibrionaceae bacterium]|nr:hypothetical protein [Pseudobdellovibrionaceae bacterium]|tara:strand:+ start:50577 stop:51113 length:537 start_codon:yes stop_codon:yes gene_type:complete